MRTMIYIRCFPSQCLETGLIHPSLGSHNSQEEAKVLGWAVGARCVITFHVGPCESGTTVPISLAWTPELWE